MLKLIKILHTALEIFNIIQKYPFITLIILYSYHRR
jgi:hypothetical protein